MEKSFLYVTQELEKEGKTIDYEYLYDIVYEDELSWKLNQSLSDSLGWFCYFEYNNIIYF